MTVFQHKEFDGHEQLVFINESRSGLKAIIAIHSSELGPALGGCRMFPYDDEQAALTDVLRLSRGMTYKAALAGLPLGGGKSVIIADPGCSDGKKRALLLAMADAIETLQGQYYSSVDVGMGVADLDVMAERCQYLVGNEKAGTAGGPSASTAGGVLIGIKAALQYRFGSDDLAGKRVALQGLGSVGFRLAELLVAQGAEVLASEINPEAMSRAVENLGVQAVTGSELLDAEVDIYAPCAMGSTVCSETIPYLKTAIIAGSANNQLATPDCGELLRQHNILYAPDFIVNAGGLIDVYQRRFNGGKSLLLEQGLNHIALVLQEVFSRSARQTCATQLIAESMARQNLREAGAVGRAA